MRRAIILTVSFILMGCNLPAQADFDNWLKKTKSKLEQSKSDKSLSKEDMAKGLRDALIVGSQRAIKKLGKKDGFLKDATVKIPVPESLRKIEKILRKTGQEKYVDQFVTTLNRAAEQAAPKTVDIFIDTIKGMSWKDVRKIVKGRDDEATRYFRLKNSDKLRQTIRPIVKMMTDKTGATKAYKRFLRKGGKVVIKLGGDLPEIDQYITEKTMDGLFLKLADEERRIRKDPVARTTHWLKLVFK